MNRFKKITNAIYIIVFCLMTGFLVYFGISENTNIESARKNTGYEAVKEYNFRSMEDDSAPAGVREEYSWTIDSINESDNCLAFYLVHQYIQVYFDDELIYSLQQNKNLNFSKTPGSCWVMIPLSNRDEGKSVRVEVTPAYENIIGRNIEFIVGSELSIYTGRMKKDMPQIVIGLIAIAVGIVFIIISLIEMIGKRDNNSLASLGTFSVMLGLWRLTDTRFSPFVMPGKTVFLFYLSIIMLILACIPFLKSLKYCFNTKITVIFDVLCVVTAPVLLVQCILQMTGVKDLRETLVIYHILIGVCTLTGAAATVYEWIKSGWNKMNGFGKGLFVLCVAGATGDIVSYYVRGTSSGLLFTLTAFLIYIIINGIANIYEFVEQKNKIKQQEAELATGRISVMLSQIQPHFLYNSLNTIYHLCEKNPSMAKKAINDFSDYLRGNLDSLKRSTPITFEKELEHVKIYLSLEKMRFDEELDIKYDIETTAFLIPALTVQPIVENAVKHGLSKTEHGGTVIISTREYEDRYEVVISDNGAGFDAEEDKNDGKTHIGIENVRKRLWAMMNATLDIFSKKGSGTKAVIKLPKEGKNNDNYCG